MSAALKLPADARTALVETIRGEGFARIPGADRGKFGFPPESLEGKDVCVIGSIQRDSSRALIEVTSPSGLKLANIKR